MITPVYIISQIITVIYVALLNSSYFLKERIKILIANLLAHIGQTIAMVLLNGYTGAAMAFIMLLRDLTLVIFEKLHIKSNKINLIIFIITIILILTLTKFTYNGYLSLLSVAATLVLTYGLWQKNVIRYKFLSIVAGLLWLAYNIFIMSIMGIILEITIIVFSTIGFIKDIKVSKARNML